VKRERIGLTEYLLKKGKVLFLLLKTGRIHDREERRECLPTIQDEPVDLSRTGTW
jgi:hypothetical protein